MKNASGKITLLLLFVAALLLAGCTSSLIKAAQKDDTKEMERLIAAGADVNVTSDGTPLYWAAFNGNVKVAELLISKGADVNLRFSSAESWTPLYAAAHKGNVEVAKLLISKGADVNVKDNDGKTPLDIAKGRGHTSIVRLLEKAKLNAQPELSNPAEEAAFAEVARNYRVAAIMPTLPEEARKFKVQAEYAFNKKEFESAVARYQEALDVAPWWPEGHFNRALILGELSRYRDAIREMKKYLMLVPDAPNARTAQDNIYRWEAELK